MSTPTPDNWCTSQTPIPPQKPSGTNGKLIKPTPSALCSMGWRRLMITGLLRDMLARHFGTPLNVEEPDLRHLVWREDERTGILIESIQRWRKDLAEKRPAIVIKANSRKNIRWGIQDATGANEQGHRLYQTFWAGSHTLFCIHGSGASADILATEVERELNEFHPLMLAYLGLYSWQVTEVDAIAELEESKEDFVVPVTVAWVYDSKWQIDLESVKLGKVALNTLLDGASING